MDDIRLIQLTTWLKYVLKDQPMEISVASADASFRRYFRIKSRIKSRVEGRDESKESWIAMDAPPDKEDCKPFIAVATAFRYMKMNVPEIFAQDLSQGFLLLTDFGDINFLDVLNQDKLNNDNVDQLYGDAMQALLSLQVNPKPNNFTLPPYDEALLSREMHLFDDWFIERHIRITLDESEKRELFQIYEVLVNNALEQPQVWVHRDYHSRNLMVLENNNPGVIDFQDAVEGPITYDLVSLLRDCYIDWPIEKVEAWAGQYLKELQQRKLCETVSNDTFLKWFDLMGVQRHLKAIGIFARLNYRDGKSAYLGDIPRTLAYVQQVSAKYEELAALNKLITSRILPVMPLPLMNNKI